MQTSLGRFRIVAFAEGVSYLLLGLTMPLKYMLSMPLPNYVVGMAHGLLFILYVGLLAYVAFRFRWSLLKVALSFLAALIPFGTFVAEKKVYGRDF